MDGGERDLRRDAFCRRRPLTFIRNTADILAFLLPSFLGEKHLYKNSDFFSKIRRIPPRLSIIAVSCKRHKKDGRQGNIHGDDEAALLFAREILSPLSLLFSAFALLPFLASLDRLTAGMKTEAQGNAKQRFPYKFAAEHK